METVGVTKEMAFGTQVEELLVTIGPAFQRSSTRIEGRCFRKNSPIQ
jgi:hypothetical protein